MTTYFPRTPTVPKGGYPNTRAKATMRTLADRYRGFMFDRYGVSKTASGTIPGAKEALRHIASLGKPIAVASNTATTLPEEIRAKWKKDGVDIPLELIFTSGMALRNFVAHKGMEGLAAINLGNSATEEYMRRAGLEPISQEDPMKTYRDGAVVVIGSDISKYDIRMLDAAINAICKKNIPVVLAVTDRLVPYSGSEVALGGASTSVLIEYYTRAKPFVIGKPSSTMFELATMAFERGGIRAEEVLMVGDSLHEDIWGGLSAGFHTLLVESGISGAVIRGEIRGTVAERDQDLLLKGVMPTYKLPSISLEGK